MQNLKENNFYIMHFCQNAIVKARRVAKHVADGIRGCPHYIATGCSARPAPTAPASKA